MGGIDDNDKDKRRRPAASAGRSWKEKAVAVVALTIFAFVYLSYRMSNSVDAGNLNLRLVEGPLVAASVTAADSSSSSDTGLGEAPIGDGASANPKEVLVAMEPSEPEQRDKKRPDAAGPKQAPPQEATAATPDSEPADGAAAAATKCDFKAVCALEASRDYEAAFKEYESLAATCGDEGWETIKVLGEGMSGRVRLRRTPCGMRVAIKEPPPNGNSLGTFSMLKAHIEVDCVVIKYLSAFRSKCNNCFPAYYYFSPTTGACYNEFIDSVPLTKYVQRLNTSTEEGVESMKSLFLQSFDALEIMKAQNMVHRDLQAQNMLVRTNTASPQLVVMDFCWINWEGVPHQFSVVGRKLGRFTRAADWKTHGEEDSYAFACAIADILFFPPSLYKNKDSDEMKYRNYCLPNMEKQRSDASSLEYVMWRMSQQRSEDRVHSFKQMRVMVNAVTHALVVTVCGGTDEDAEAQVRAFDGDVNAFDAEGNTLLYWAADNGKARTIAALAARGADPLLQTQAGVTVLDWAVYQDNGSMEALFDAFPDLDVNVARRSDGMTPLHQAAAYGLVASVRVLLGRGARMDIWNGENETAQDAAREMEQEETEELLARAATSEEFLRTLVEEETARVAARRA